MGTLAIHSSFLDISMFRIMDVFSYALRTCLFEEFCVAAWNCDLICAVWRFILSGFVIKIINLFEHFTVESVGHFLLLSLLFYVKNRRLL